MERWTDQAAKGDGSSGAVSARPRRQRSWEVDVQRARALRGDALEDLTESQREWVWRSLLRGVRLSQATKLAQRLSVCSGAKATGMRCMRHEYDWPSGACTKPCSRWIRRK